MNKATYFGMFTLLFAVASFFLQTTIFLNSDVALLLHETRLFMMGGNYVTDFFETNPPMIFYLYSPAQVIHFLFSLNIDTAVHGYIILLALLSVVCCYHLINRIIKKEDSLVAYSFLYTLLFVLFFMPAVEFGQREHLFLIIMIPYLLAAVCAAMNQKINPVFAFLLGAMMGIGVGLKPYFLLPLIFMEVYLILIKRRFWGWVRVESLVCASVLVIYLISILLWQMNYIKVLLPLINHLYFSSIQETWTDIFLRPTVYFCLTVVGFYFFQSKKKYRELLTMLWVALVGMILAFIMARAAWFYHVIPAMGLACLLISLYGSLFILSSVHKRSLAKKDLMILAVSIMLVFFIPLQDMFILFKHHMTRKSHSSFSQLIDKINEFPSNSSVFCFSVVTTADCFPLVYLTHNYFGSRMPFFWWLRGMLQAEKDHLPVLDKEYLIDSIADDLNHYRTQLIIINVKQAKLVFGEDFDYIAYLSQNKNFRNAWKHYDYVTQVNDVFQIYKRKVGE